MNIVAITSTDNQPLTRDQSIKISIISSKELVCALILFIAIVCAPDNNNEQGC